MVVDDEPEIVDLLTKALAMDRHRVVVAPIREESLRVLASQSFDLVLSDLCMPKIDGICLQALAAALPHPPPFLFMTGNTLSTTGQPDGRLPLPMIEKPLRPTEVRRVVAEELARMIPS